MKNRVIVEEKQVWDLLDWCFDRTMREKPPMDFTALYGWLVEAVQAALLTVAANPEEVEEIIKAERLW